MSETIKTSPNRYWNDKAYRENFPEDMGQPEELFMGVDMASQPDKTVVINRKTNSVIEIRDCNPSFIDAYENIAEKEEDKK